MVKHAPLPNPSPVHKGFSPLIGPAFVALIALIFGLLFNSLFQLEAMGRRGHEHVRQNFLITRQLREYLAVMLALVRAASDRIELH